VITQHLHNTNAFRQLVISLIEQNSSLLERITIELLSKELVRLSSADAYDMRPVRKLQVIPDEVAVCVADEQGRHLVYVSVYALSELTLGLYQEGISLVKKILRQVKNFLVPREDLAGGTRPNLDRGK